MAIQVKTYDSKASIQVPALPPAAVQGAPLDVSKSQVSDMLKQVGDAAKGVTKEWAEEAKARQEATIAADVLAESNKYHDETRAFESNYRETRKGADARNAAQDFDEFHRKQIEERSARFTGDPRVQLLWMRQADQVRQGSLNRAVEYADHQDKVYREETTNGRIQTYYQKVAEVGDDDKAVNNLRMQLNGEVQALNPGRDLTAKMAEIDQNTATTRINTAVAQRDAARAERLLGEYKGVLGNKFDEAQAHVTSAKKQAAVDAGVDLATSLYNSNTDPSAAWQKIAAIGDKDTRQSAQSQYSALQTMKMKIEEDAYASAAVDLRTKIDGTAPTNLPAASAMVESMPEASKLDRKKKAFAMERLNEWKRASGMNPLTDAGSYLGIREDVLAGRITTKEQVLSDPRSAKVTMQDLNGDLVKLLDTAQQAHDKVINDAFEQAFGAKKWKNLQKTNPDLTMNYLKQAKDQVRTTNRAGDTDYIQKVADTLAISGVQQTGFKMGDWFREVKGGDSLAAAVRSGDVPADMNKFKQDLASGSAKWLPATTPSDFDAVWNTQIDQGAWQKLYGDKAKKAAYLSWKLYQIGPRR